MEHLDPRKEEDRIFTHTARSFLTTIDEYGRERYIQDVPVYLVIGTRKHLSSSLFLSVFIEFIRSFSILSLARPFPIKILSAKVCTLVITVINKY